jgi:selT/selW/selH-like putative selenoprotein
LQAAIQKAFGIDAVLREGHGGVFDVTIDGTRVYSKHETSRFPTDQEIFAHIRARLAKA